MKKKKLIMKRTSKPEIIIISGLSGAGKSIAIKAIEDFGGFCVDNMPVALIMQFAQLLKTSNHAGSLIALGIDVRSPGFLGSMFDLLTQIKKIGFRYKLIFLDASDTILIRRFSESRRPHPLSKKNERLQTTIKKERKLLLPLRAKSDILLETSSLSPHDLKRKLKKVLFEKADRSININIITFGFKYGVPEDVDMLIDTRFLPNPHYNPELSSKTGNNSAVRKFVLQNKLSEEFLDKYTDILGFLIPNYINEGKSYLNIGIACTGGKHRSVVIANEIKKHLNKIGFNVNVTHRDISR